MARGKLTALKKRKVWRISSAAPLGEFVDPDARPPATAPAEQGEAPSAIHRSWSISSFELMNGVDISEEDPSTVPADLFDELFKPSKK